MKKLFIMILILLSAIFACSCRREQPPEIEDSLAADSDVIKQISPGATVLWRTFCTWCGHTYTYKDASAVIGLTREEAAARFSEWRIAAFTADYAVFTRSIAGICPEHFLLLLSDGRLFIMRAAEPELELEVFCETDGAKLIFKPSETAMLEDGIVFDSLIELDGFLSERIAEYPSAK